MMRAMTIGGRFAILIVVVLMISCFLGRPFIWDVQMRIQRAVVTPSSSGVIHSIAQNSSTSDNNVEPSSGESDEQRQTEKVVVDSSAEVPADSSPAKPNRTEDEAREQTQDASPAAEESRPLHKDLRRAIWDVPPASSVMPPTEEFVLRKEMVDFRAKENVIAVTFTNYAFMDFVRSWVKSLTNHGVTNILVGAMDTRALQALYWTGIPAFDMGSNMKSIDVGWGSPSFHKMGREKVILVNVFLNLDYELLMCDTDIVWLRNPLPYIKRYPDADVLTSSDAVVNSVDDDSLERPYTPGAYNIGINHWRPTAVAKSFAAEWLEQLQSDDIIWDQNGFNELMQRKTGPEVNNSGGLFFAFDGQLKLGILPVSMFCSGHTYFVQKIYKQLGLQPYAVHTTFQYAGTEGKKHRLREAKLFDDPPEYYNASGGYLSYIPSLPENLLRGGAHTVESHFKLVNHQLLQVRSALSIASTLNRTLVMPELWCRFDRMWYPHPGILPGTRTKQPFLCPMDHIFEVNMWVENRDEERYGPQIRFREYSFLDNPRLPSEVKASTLRVSLCDPGTVGCDAQPGKVSVPGALQLPRNSMEDELKAVLSPYSEAGVIEFSSMLGAFGNFSDEVRATQFSKRIKLYTGMWCCVEALPGKPGHIWYDIYWDQKPGWKPRPPATASDDHQP